MSSSPEVRLYAGEVGGLSRSRAANDPDLLAARRNLRAAKLRDHIKKVVDEAPPLTEAQRADLAALLRGAR